MNFGSRGPIFYGFHGFLGNPGDWDVVRSQVKGIFVAPDLLSPEAPVIEDWPIYIEKFFSRQGVEPHGPKILIGYSMGGRLSLEILREKFWHWDQIVLISTNPGFLSDDEKRERFNSDEKWAQRFQADSWDNIISAWNDQAVFAATKQNLPRESEFSRDQLARALRLWSLGKTRSHSIETLSAPNIHWLVGEQDQKFLRELSKQESLNLHVVPKAGHRVLKDNPEFVLNFLKTIVPNLQDTCIPKDLPHSDA